MNLRVFGVVLGALIFIQVVSCSSVTFAEQAARRTDVKITANDPNNPTSYRFELYRTPYADEQDPQLPVNTQIKLGMRRFAEEQVLERRLCPHGFSGPAIVSGSSKDRYYYFFHIYCLPEKK